MHHPRGRHSFPRTAHDLRFPTSKEQSVCFQHDFTNYSRLQCGRATLPAAFRDSFRCSPLSSMQKKDRHSLSAAIFDRRSIPQPIAGPVRRRRPAAFPDSESKTVQGDPENAHRWALLFTPGIRVRMMHGRSIPFDRLPTCRESTSRNSASTTMAIPSTCGNGTPASVITRRAKWLPVCGPDVSR